MTNILPFVFYPSISQIIPTFNPNIPNISQILTWDIFG